MIFPVRNDSAEARDKRSLYRACNFPSLDPEYDKSVTQDLLDAINPFAKPSTDEVPRRQAPTGMSRMDLLSGYKGSSYPTDTD